MRLGADAVCLWSVTGETRVVGERLLIFRAGRVVLAESRARRRGERRYKDQKRGALGHRLHPRRVAPVFFETSATILAIAASISASVNVRSRGCSLTLIAMDFEPSGRPLPW